MKGRKVLSSELEGFFWSQVRKLGRGCWPWTGDVDKDGYGRLCLRVLKGQTRAHRVAWTLSRGKVPKGMSVLHTCDNPPCCNPKHLFLGTSLDNVKDRNRKGRTASGDRCGSRLHPEALPRGKHHWSHTHPEKVLKGEHNGRCKLTARQVECIRQRYAAGGVTQKELGRAFGVIQPHISRIVLRANWKHVGSGQFP